MQLVERGEVAVTDPVEDYLPYLSEAPGEPITVRDLLSHTSGLPAHPTGPLYSEAEGLGHLEVPLSSRADFRRLVEGSLDRRVTDRETLFYYNAGYTMLGFLVESVTGQPVGDYVTEHLLVPLGMERSTFERAEFEAADDRMRPYVTEDGSSVPSAVPFDEFLRAPGGLVSSATEMTTWLRALAGGGAVDGVRVLEPDSVAAMTTPVGTFQMFFDGSTIEYGYGLTVQSFLGDRLVGHGGSIGVSNAVFGYLEDAAVGIVVLCGTRPEAHVLSLGMALLAILQGRDPERVVPHYRLVSTLERATGSYEPYPNVGEVTVERDGGDLRVTRDLGFGADETVFTPTRIDEDVLVCRTLGVDGTEREARFEFDEEEVRLFEARDLFRKSG